jgi:anti-sigma factor RsiW
MEPALRCEEVEPLLPALAVGALDADERAAVQAHVLACPLCRPQFLAYEATAAQLAYAVPPAEPPPALGPQLLAAVVAARNGVEPTPTRAIGGDISRKTKPPTGLLNRLAGVYRQVAPLGFAVAVVLVVMLGGGMWNMNGLAQQGQQTQALLGMPNAHVVPLQPMTTTAATGNVYMAPQADKMGLLVANLKPQPGRVYKFWLVMKNGHLMLGGEVPVDARGAAFTMIPLPVALAESQGVRITDEPPGPATTPIGTLWLEADY